MELTHRQIFGLLQVVEQDDTETEWLTHALAGKDIFAVIPPGDKSLFDGVVATENQHYIRAMRALFPPMDCTYPGSSTNVYGEPVSVCADCLEYRCSMCWTRYKERPMVVFGSIYHVCEPCLQRKLEIEQLFLKTFRSAKSLHIIHANIENGVKIRQAVISCVLRNWNPYHVYSDVWEVSLYDHAKRRGSTDLADRIDLESMVLQTRLDHRY